MLYLSETIQVALITLASAAIGAIAGIAGTIISSKYSSSTQMNQTVIQEYFKQRTEAYVSLLTACDKMKHDPFSDENILFYTKAIQVAVLVASSSTAHKIIKYDETIGGRCTQEEKDFAYTEMLSALQHDLINYSKPSIK